MTADERLALAKALWCSVADLVPPKLRDRVQELQAAIEFVHNEHATEAMAAEYERGRQSQAAAIEAARRVPDASWPAISR